MIFQIAPPEPIQAPVRVIPHERFVPPPPLPRYQTEETVIDPGGFRTGGGGRNVRCPQCQALFQIPAPQPEPPVPMIQNISIQQPPQPPVMQPPQPQITQPPQPQTTQQPQLQVSNPIEPAANPQQSNSSAPTGTQLPTNSEGTTGPKFPERRNRFQSTTQQTSLAKKGSTTASKFSRTAGSKGEVEEEGPAPKKKRGSLLWLWILLLLGLLGGGGYFIYKKSSEKPPVSSAKEAEDLKKLVDQNCRTKADIAKLADESARDSITKSLDTITESIESYNITRPPHDSKVTGNTGIVRVGIRYTKKPPEGEPKEIAKTLILRFEKKVENWILLEVKESGSSGME